MSRIDEALRRTQDKSAGPEPTSPEGQKVFAPAWSVTLPATPKALPDVTPASEESGRALGTREPSPAGMLSFSSQWRERLAGGPDGDPGLIEQFRRLAGVLHHAQQNNGLRSVMVTSAAAGDGKTLTAVNLALVLAESYGYTVLLVDADLRRPSIPSVVDLGDGCGLSEALRAATEQKVALVPITSRLTLLPAGQPIANSIEALTSPRMRQILDEATKRFDWVILDAPPVGPAADARLLTALVGGTLFVIHAGQSQYPEVQKAIDTIGREQILGVVLNGVEGNTEDGYYGVARQG
ncbi:MAG: CpsD/CapB family tyrosine-protein kinase [Acidobacteriota bacterium]